MCDGIPGDQDISDKQSIPPTSAKDRVEKDETDPKRLEYLIVEFIDLFQGQGDGMMEQLADAHRKAAAMVVGLDDLCGVLRSAAPYMAGNHARSAS